METILEYSIWTFYFLFSIILTCGFISLFVLFLANTKVPEVWEDREPTDKEIQAVTILQARLKGYLVRAALKASKPGKGTYQYMRNIHLIESNLRFHSLLKFAWFIKLSCEAEDPIMQDLHSYQ